MFRIWGKVIKDGHIIRQTTYEREEKFTYAHFFNYLADICDALVETFTSGDFSFTGLTTAGEAATWSDTGEVSKQPMGMVIEGGVYMPLDA